MSSIEKMLLVTVTIAAPTVSISCGPAEQSGSSSDIVSPDESISGKHLLSAHNAIQGSNLDWVHCGTERGADGYPQYCYVGNGGKYIAYGAPNTSSFYFQHFTENSTVYCNNATFGDPAPGQTKACYFANFSQLATQGNTFTPYSKFGTGEYVDVAYGGNGIFAFTTVYGYSTFTCTRDLVGLPSEPNPSGPNDCYQALVGYHKVASEGSNFVGNSSHATAVAFGNNGTYYYTNIQGSSISCSAANFGAPSGSGRNCFAVALTSYYKTSEGGQFTVPSGNYVNYAQFTSGKDGNVIPAYLSAGTWTCNAQLFGGLDPDYGETKHCYEVSYIP